MSTLMCKFYSCFSGINSQNLSILGYVLLSCLQRPSPDRQGWCTDSMHTTFIHPSLSIQQTLNPFHVYTYISCWGSERQSTSLEIIFDPLLTHTSVLPSSGWQTMSV